MSALDQPTPFDTQNGRRVALTPAEWDALIVEEIENQDLQATTEREQR